MVTLLLSPVLDSVLGALRSFAFRELAVAWGLKTDVENLESMLSAIRAVLQDAEQKQWKNAAVKNWLTKLRDVAYTVDDLIDEFSTSAALWKLRSKRGALHKAGRYFFLPERLLYCLMVGEKIREVHKKLSALANEKQLQLITTLETGFTSARVTTSVASTSKLYGLDTEKAKVMNVVIKNLSERDDLLVYAIYGMAGLGKTTLAKMVFHDPNVSTSLLRLWVCVSINFDIPRLIRAILESISGRECNLQEVESLQLILKQKLKGKRFLLALDDVWNEDQGKWEEFKDILSCGEKGSTIIVTTRIKKIAEMMAPKHTHRLTSLSKDDSWSLFKQQAIDTRKREEYPWEGYMDTIGKDILTKCCGVPLVIKALGSLMRSKNEEHQWRSVLDSEIWKLKDGMDNILSALSVSFYNLAPHLRQCFAYCCVFPKDFELDKDDLIQCWLANGLITSNQKMNWYETGDGFFHELVSRSFIQDVEEKIDGTKCKIHDLMHDLASFIIGDGDDRISKAGLQISAKDCHLYFGMRSTCREVVLLTKFKSFRSLFQHGYGYPRPLGDPSLLAKLNRLRVLNIRGVRVNKVAVSISKLSHLRYLNLSRSDIKALPKSIIYLQNLESLNLEYCDLLRELPGGIKYMKSLRCLNIRGCHALKNMPEMELLKNQQILVNGLIVDLGNNGRQIADLREVNLCGELSLRRLLNITTEGAKEADLKSKTYIRTLRLFWEKGDQHIDGVNALQPHSNLKKLEIDSYTGLKFPSWIDNLQNLTEISLCSCVKCEHLPPLEKLPFLTDLLLRLMPSVKFLVTKIYDERVTLFPALRSLRLFDMPSLTELMAPENKAILFESLKHLTVESCENLFSQQIDVTQGLSSLQSLCVDSYEQLVSLSKGVNELQELTIKRFCKIDTSWERLQHLSSVCELSIIHCKELSSLPEWLGDLKSLTKLSIESCHNLTSMLEYPQCLGALLSLQISNCEKLSDLPDCLGTLKLFSSWNCPKLTSLPKGLLKSTSLEVFHIIKCPTLERRCSKERGEYWPDIARTPYMWIGDRVIKSSN